MILINNSQPSEFTIPVQSLDDLEFWFTHHLSGKQIIIICTPINPILADYFTTIIFSGKFKYLGLYSLSVKNLLQETIYTTLATVSENKQAAPTYTNGIKDYELYK